MEKWLHHRTFYGHYSDIIMSVMASQITRLIIVYLTVHSSTDQRKHQSSTSLAFVWGIHRWPVNSPHKGPVTRKMFPFDDVIMDVVTQLCLNFNSIVCWKLVQADDKEIIKAKLYWPSVLEIYWSVVSPFTTEWVSNTWSVPYHDIIMKWRAVLLITMTTYIK